MTAPRSTVRSVAAVVAIAASLAVSTGCGSDDEPDVENPPDPEVPFDVTVDDGIDTNVEQPGNLNFDVEQPALDD